MELDYGLASWMDICLPVDFYPINYLLYLLSQDLSQKVLHEHKSERERRNA